MEDSSSLVPAESGPADSVSLLKLTLTVGHKERHELETKVLSKDSEYL